MEMILLAQTRNVGLVTKIPTTEYLSAWQLGPNIHWTTNYGTGIVFIGNMLSWLSFHNFV